MLYRISISSVVVGCCVRYVTLVCYNFFTAVMSNVSLNGTFVTYIHINCFPVLSLALCVFICFFFFFKQKTAYEMRISDWSSDVCSSDLLTEEFKDVHLIAAHSHGPGLLHVKGDGVETLEDMEGLKLRGPTRQANALISALGATPVGMPVPAMPEALSKGVIDGTVIPWEVTTPLKVAELVDSHTDFAGPRGLYTSFFVFAMRSEEHTSELQSLMRISYAVFCLKKQTQHIS